MGDFSPRLSNSITPAPQPEASAREPGHAEPPQCARICRSSSHARGTSPGPNGTLQGPLFNEIVALSIPQPPQEQPLPRVARRPRVQALLSPSAPFGRPHGNFETNPNPLYVLRTLCGGATPSPFRGPFAPSRLRGSLTTSHDENEPTASLPSPRPPHLCGSSSSCSSSRLVDRAQITKRTHHRPRMPRPPPPAIMPT